MVDIRELVFMGIIISYFMVYKPTFTSRLGALLFPYEK